MAEGGKRVPTSSVETGARWIALRATGPVYRASFSTGGFRRLTPRFLPVFPVTGATNFQLGRA
jgi:hypothetical protein